MTTRTREWWEAPPEESAPRGYRLVPVAEPRGLSSAPKKDEGYGVGDIAKDAALSVLGKGAVGLGETVMGVADLATGGRAGRWAQEHLGYDPQAAKEQLSDWQSDTMKRHRAGYEQAKKSAEGLPLKDRLAAIAFGAMENPLVIADTIGESVPSIFAGGGVGGVALKSVAGRAGAKALEHATAKKLAQGATQEAAKQFGRRAQQRVTQNLIGRAGTYTGALGEGVVGMGGAAEQLRQGKDELIAAEEKRRKDAGLAPMTDAEKAQMQQFNARDYGAALGTAGTTALFGAAGGKLGAKLGLADIETRVARGTAGLQGIGAQEAVQQAKRGILGRVLGGAAQEGLLEELPQSVTETLWQNWAQGKEDIWEGVDEAAVMGVLSGAAMGAGANIRGQRARGAGEPRGLPGVRSDDANTLLPQANLTDSSVAGGDVAPTAGAGASTSAQEQEAGDAAGGQALGARGAAGEAEMAGAQADAARTGAADTPSGAPDAAPRDDVSDALGAGAAVAPRSALAEAVLGNGAEDGGSAALSYEQLAQMRQGARDNRVRAAIAEELQARRAQVEAASTDELAALRNETGQGSAARTVIDRQLARRAGALSEDTAQALATDGAANALPDTDLAAAYDALTARQALSMQDGNQLPIPARGGALERVAGELDRRSGMDDATNAGGAFPLARSSWSDAVLQDIADYAYSPETRAVAAGALAARRGDTEAAGSWRNNIPPRRSDGQPAAFQQWQQEREQKRAARSDAANQLSDTLEQAKQQGGMLSGAAVDNAAAIPALNEPRGFAALPMPQTLGATPQTIGAAAQTLGAAPQVSGAYPAQTNAPGAYPVQNGAYPAQRAAQPPDAPMQNAAMRAAQGAATLPALSPTAAANQGALSDRTAGDRAAASSGEPIAQGGAMVNRAGDRAPLTKAQEAEGERAFSAAQETLPGVRKLQGELMKVGFAPEAAATLAQMPWQQIPAAVRPAVYQALANSGLVRAQRGFTDGEYARVWRRLPEQARVQVLAQAGFADAAALARRAWAALPAKAKEAAKAAIDTGYRNWQRTEGEGSIPMPDAASQPSGAIGRTQRSAIGRNAPAPQLGFDAGVNERAEARSRAEQAMNAAQRADEQARADVARWQALHDARRGAETARNPQPRKLRDGSKDAWRFQTSQVQPDAESARILQGAPVAQVRRADKLNGDKVEVARAAAEIFKQQGGKASRADIGDVVLDRNSAESSAFHGELTEVRRATFGAIQNVIERGALIAHAWHDNFESFYISAPITIDGVENIMTVTLRHSRSKHALYIHAVMLKENLLPGESSAAANASGRSGTEEAAGGFASVPEGIKNGKYERAEIRQRLRELLTMEATSNGKAAPAAEQKKKPAPKKKAGIEDFGEKLGGARKDAYAKARQTMERELSNSDIANLPMSEIFPASVVDAIEDVPAAALVKAMRDIIPRKPRGVLKVRWAAQVQQLRGLAQDLVSGRFSVEQMHERLLEPDSSTTGLRELSDKARLLEQIPREQWGRIGEVYSRRQYTPQGYNIPDGTASLMLDGKLVGHIPQDELADRVRRLLEKDAPQKPTLQLEVRYNASEGVVFICKKGDRLMHRLKTFPYDKDGGRAALQKAANEATAFIKEHISELDAAWEKVKERENVHKEDVRRKENRPRVGRDWRGGKDATPEMFTQQFGFRGVEFGNWVGQGAGAKERQGLLNQAYDALMDLADLLGIDSRAVSLNGSLGLSFGARGRGGKNAPAAHFEPLNLVIALTKSKGAGTLAHEWFHALDNYFSRMRDATKEYGKDSGYITYKPEPGYVRRERPSGVPVTRAWLERQRQNNPHNDYYAEENWIPDPKHPQGVRPEVERNFGALVEALDASPMVERARKADKISKVAGQGRGYWSRIIERGARAFENYINYRLEQRGQSNDYLANIRPAEEFVRDDASYPYLLESEMAPVEQAFDALFAGMKQRETEKGVALFSRSKKQTVPEKMRAAAAEREFKETEKAYGGKAAYDAAKKAGKTKLTYQQWVQVRTPSFKKWFGNWEAKRARDAVMDMDAVPVKVPALWHDLPAKAWREEVRKAFDGAKKQGAVTMRDGREVRLTAVGFKETKQHSGIDRKALNLLANIREVLAQAHPITSVQHERAHVTDSVRAWHYYTAKVQMEGEPWLVRLVVREDVNGNIYYDNDLTSIEALENSIGGRGNHAARTKSGAPSTSADEHTLAQLLGDGKRGDVSAVVDEETGEPQVVYHGTHVREEARDRPGVTPGDITSFDREFVKKGVSMDTVGSWFSTNPGEGGAEMYSGNGEHGGSVIYPVFLNIRNPLATTFETLWKTGLRLTGKKYIPRPSITAESYREWKANLPGTAEVDAYRAWLASMGKDGIRIEDDGSEESGEFSRQTAIIALEPNQIKSATGNIGTFDASNPDIRFRRGDTPATNTPSPASEAGIESDTAAKPLTAKQRSTVNRVKLMAASIRRVWVNAPQIEVVWDAQDARVPEAIRAQDAAMRSQGAEGDAEAVYHNGKVFVFASQVNTPRDMVRVVAHEVLGHHGLRGAFGRGMARVLNELMIARRAEVVQQAREYGLLDTDKLPAGVDAYAATDAQVWAAMSEHDRQQAAEEVLAHLAETYPQLPLVRRAIAAIRTWLRQHVPGFDRMGVSDDEIVRSFILPAREWVQRGMGVGTAPGTPLFRRAWHGGSAGIEREGFKLQKIGTGEGAQAFGWGMYFASQQRIADWYRKQYKIDHPERDAALYALEIPEDEDLLAWDAPLSESSVAVQRGVQQALQLHGTNIADLARALYPDGKGSAMGLVTGKDVYNALAGMAREVITVPFGNDLGENMRRDRRAASVAQRSASEDLYSVGIPGLRYLDETSRERGEASRDGRPMGSKRRTKGEGTYNYVIWDESLLTPEAAQITPMFSRSAQKSVEANITRGRAAMNRALLEKADQHRAMFRNGLGWVDFVWGDAKRGIAHIIAERQAKDGMTLAQIERMLGEQVVPAIAQGAETQRFETAKGAVRVYVEHEGVRASLVRQPGSNAWLLTAFELKTPGAKAAANDTAKATHRAADSSDGAAGAGVAPHPAGRGATPSADTAAAPIRTRHSGGSNDSVSSKRASSQAPLFSRSKKPQTPEQRADALRYGGAGTASEQRMSFMESALAHAGRIFTHPGRVSLWDKTLGTPRHLAERVPAFKPVYEAAMATVEDVSTLANMVMDAAPRWIPKLESWKNLAPWRKEFTRAVSAKDSKAVAKPLFEGTLVWGRDGHGKLVQTDELQRKYGWMDTAQMGKALMRDGFITESQLKGWQAMPKNQYDNMVKGVLEDIVRGGTTFSNAELREHFNLTDAQISLYREARAAIDNSLDLTTRTDMLRLVQHEFGSRRDEWQQLRQEVLDAESLDAARRTIKNALEDFAKDAKPKHAEALRALADDLGDRVHRVQELMRRGYAPLTRFGRYTVDVVDEATGERLYFGMYESRAESNLARIKLAQTFAGAKITQGTLSEREFELFQGVTPETLELFGQALALDSEGGEASDLVFQEYLRRTKNNHSALKRMIHRKGIAGYSEDVGRVLASFIYSNARAGSQAMNAGQLEKAITEIPKSQGQLKDLAVGLRDYLRNPREGGQIVRGFLFAQYLGGSVASALVNATQPFQVTMPWLSQFGGMAKASRQMARALKDMPTGNYEPALKKALKAAEADGTVSPQEIHHLMAQARGVGSLSSGDGTKAGRARAVAGNAWQRLKVAWGVPFSLAEQFNRRTTFIAAWRTATEQLKMDEAEAAEFARKAVQETQFVYCVDGETECLTTEGWKKRDALKVGDTVIGVDMLDGGAVETPLLAVHQFPGRHAVTQFSNATHFSMVVTGGHKNIVQNYSSKNKRWLPPMFRETVALRDGHHLMRVPQVPIARAEGGDEDFAALLGWIATEGYYARFRGCKEKRNVRLYQSSTCNPHYVEEIEALLQRLGGHYRKFHTHHNMVTFTLRKPLSERVLQAMPEKLLTWKMAQEMTVPEMRALMDAFAKGDGTKAAKDAWLISQKKVQNLHVLQAMSVMCGRNATMYPPGKGDGDIHHLYLHGQGLRTMVKQLDREETEVTDGVWCPETGTGTWIARRNGAVFVTGNSKGNKPVWARGTIGGGLFTFKVYMVSYLELMQRMWTQGGKEGKRAVAWSLAMLLLVGGAGGVPFMEDAEDIIDGMGQLMGYNISTKAWREEFLRETLGETLGGFLESGVSGLPGAPIDVAGRLGMGNLIPGTGLLLTKRDRSQDLKEMAGAAGDFISRAYGGIKTGIGGLASLASGDVEAAWDAAKSAAEEVAPKAVQNAKKGMDMFRHGMYRDSKGYKVIDTTAAEALAKLIGFQPGSVARVQEANSFMMRSKSFYQQKAADIRLEWAQALFEKDETKLARVRQKLADWNRKNPDQRITVDMRAIWKRVREMNKSRSQRIADTAPKALRRQMRERLAEG